MTLMKRLKLSQKAVNRYITAFWNIIEISINGETDAMLFDSCKENVDALKPVK